MSRRCYRDRFRCAEPGCEEHVNYETSTREEQRRLWQRQQSHPYRCTRHSQPDELLSAQRPRIVHEIASKRQRTDSGVDIGVYRGNWGMLHGPGFKAFAKDFPEGTVLRVTAEIILPEQEAAP